MNNNPYGNKRVEEWDSITSNLISEHPLKVEEIVHSVLCSWTKILKTKIGNELQIGQDVFPSPQIMGNYIHLMVSHFFQKKYPESWRTEIEKNDKDLVCITNDYFSIEIKTSSQDKIFGNRSYGQEGASEGKQKYGYYLAILFEKFDDKTYTPRIKQIKFGWLDHSDWKSQKAATGQNSTLSKDAWNHKMKTIYDMDNKELYSAIDNYLS